MNIQTLRSVRFHDVALFDYFATIACAFLTTLVTSVPISLTTIILFVLSIVFHYYFQIRTPTNVYLNL